MPLYAFKGKSPRVHPTAFVAPTAVLIGDVTLHEHASVWFGTVLRGDMDRIEIGARSNVQDNSTIHTDENEASVLVGGCVVGTGTIIGAGAVVREKMTVPPHSLVVGVPAKVVREARPDDERWTVRAAEHYVELSAWYRDNVGGPR